MLLSGAIGAQWNFEDEPSMNNLLNSDGMPHNAAVAACDEGLVIVMGDGLGM